MAKSYDECFTENVEKVREEIDLNPQLEWYEVVTEIVEDKTFRSYSDDTLQNILARSAPHDEWGVHCGDKTDVKQVHEAMAYVALREDVIEELEPEYE